MLRFLQETFGGAALPFIPPLIHVAFVLLFGFLVMRLIDSGLRRVRSIVTHGGAIRTARLDQRTETLRQIIRSVCRIALAIVILLTIAPELGFKIEGLLAGAGIVGLAIGFGAQSLVKDVISGFFILLEDQYGVGDVVRIGSQDGVVEHMSLRVTVLRNLEGHVHVIPNGNIQTVTVLTKDWSRAVIDVTVGQKEDLNRVIEILRNVASGLATDMPDSVLEKPQVLGIERLSDEGVTIRCMVKTLPPRQADVLRTWRRRIKDRFDEAGIEIPGKVMVLISEPDEQKQLEQPHREARV